MLDGMRVTEKAAYTAFQKQKDEWDEKIILLKVERDGIIGQMRNLEIIAHERGTRFVRGDVIEYQKSVGFSRDQKTQTRRVVLYKYHWPYGDLRPDWRVIKKDFSLSDACPAVWIRSNEMPTARKIGTWDFKNVKFVPIAK